MRCPCWGAAPNFRAMRHVDPCAALVVKDRTMQTQSLPDVHFEAMKDVARLAWLLNFEALAVVPPKASAVSKVIE